MDYRNKRICITGGTSFLAHHLVKTLLEKRCEYIRLTSRDEVKQSKMKEYFNNDSRLRFVISDVRNYKSTEYTFKDIDIVIHAGAYKKIDALEYAPWEAIQSNTIGAKNVIDAAITQNVKKVVGISTDKACMPISIYGTSKFAAEKLFTHGNVYSDPDDTQLCACRYGNVFASTGSLYHIFKQQSSLKKPLTITHPLMTRFFMQVEQSVDLIEYALDNMKGNGELFVPKCPSFNIMDLASCFSEDFVYTGLRGIEKIHETLISREEMMETIESDMQYTILPVNPIIQGKWKYPHNSWESCKSYSSDTNKQFLTKNNLHDIISEYNRLN
jgi:UDP-N-acetylglucosamine 4,6-dehydratase/5-epimerase